MRWQGNPSSHEEAFSTISRSNLNELQRIPFLVFPANLVVGQLSFRLPLEAVADCAGGRPEANVYRCHERGARGSSTRQTRVR